MIKITARITARENSDIPCGIDQESNTVTQAADWIKDLAMVLENSSHRLCGFTIQQDYIYLTTELAE